MHDVSDALAQGSPADTENPRSADVAGDVMVRRETLELVRAYYRIADDSTRRALYHLVKATADAECKKLERTTSKQAAAAV